MIAIFGIMVAHDLIWLYVFVFITGATFPGRAIVAISWLMEYQKKSAKQLILFFKLISMPILIIIFTLIYQFGTRHYRYVWIVAYSLCLAATVYEMIYVPESPNFLVEQGNAS